MSDHRRWWARCPTGPPGPWTMLVLQRWVIRRRVRLVAAVGPARLRRPQRHLRPAVARQGHPAGRPLASLRRPSADGGRVDRGRTGPVRSGPRGAAGPAAGVAGHAVVLLVDHRRPADPGPPPGGSTIALRLQPVAAPRAPALPGQALGGQPPVHLGWPPPAWWSSPPPPAWATCSATGTGSDFDLVFLWSWSSSCSSLLLVALPGRESRRTGTARAGGLRPGPRHHRAATGGTPSTTSPCGTTSRGSSPASRWWPTRSSTG